MNRCDCPPKNSLAGLRGLGDWWNPFDWFEGDPQAQGEASQSMVEEFRQKSNQFTQEFHRLENNRQILVNAGYGEEFDSVYSAATVTMNTISSAASMISDAWGWAMESFGLAGIRGLGIAPLVPAAIIAGAIAAITYIISDMYELNTRADLLRSGMDPAQINAGLGAPGSELSKTIIYAVFGVAAILIVPKLLERK